MVQNTTVIDRVQTKNPIKQILVVASAIADLIAVASLLAGIVNQDLFLILLIIVIAIILISIVYYTKFLSNIGITSILIVFIISLVISIIAWSLLVGTELTPIKINITNPPDSSNVTMENLVKGMVSDTKSKVYVIIHPLNVSEMWVQQIPIVEPEGNWKCTSYFGTETLGIGEQYEVIALATNNNFLVNWATGNSLSEGQKLTSLPHKSNRSNLVTVTRPNK